MGATVIPYFKMPEQRIAQGVILLALAVTLWRLRRVLSWQNVAACGLLIALCSGLIEVVGSKTGIPFGPSFYTENLGCRLFGKLPWPVPLLWVVVVLNARGVVQLILKPWRASENYGFWAIGLAALLAGVFYAGLEPIAFANRWWNWTDSTHQAWSWYGAPWINFPSRMLIALLLLVFSMPWLLIKKPGGELPSDYVPLGLWLLSTLLLAVGNGLNHFWAAAALMVIIDAILVTVTWRNSRKGKF